jgi:hypothetical protein
MVGCCCARFVTCLQNDGLVLSSRRACVLGILCFNSRATSAKAVGEMSEDDGHRLEYRVIILPLLFSSIFRKKTPLSASDRALKSPKKSRSKERHAIKPLRSMWSAHTVSPYYDCRDCL